MGSICCGLRRILRLLILVVPAALLGCGQTSSHPSLGEIQGEAVGEISSNSNGAPISGDQSLSTEEYQRLGLPAVNHAWTSMEMDAAADALDALAQKHMHQLPRYESKRSGMVFRRLTSSENLSRLKSAQLSSDAKLEEAKGYVTSSVRLLEVYMPAHRAKAVTEFELVELMAAIARSSAAALEVSSEYLATVNMDDPTYQQRIEGLEQAKKGIAKVVEGCLGPFKHSQAYNYAALANLLSHLQDSLPRLVVHLPNKSKDEVIVTLDRLVRDPALKQYSSGLDQLRANVKKALQRSN